MQLYLFGDAPISRCNAIVAVGRCLAVQEVRVFLGLVDEQLNRLAPIEAQGAQLGRYMGKTYNYTEKK